MRPWPMLARIHLALLIAVVVAGLPSCNQEPRDTSHTATSASATPLEEAQLFADSPSGARFSLPSRGLRTSVEHYDATLPPQKIRHSVTVTAVGTRLVRIDLWDNPEKLSLQQWFERHLAFTVADGATVEQRRVGVSHAEGIVVNQLRSPQSEARRIAVFASGARIVRVTCYDSADEQSVKVFDRVTESFDSEVTP